MVAASLGACAGSSLPDDVSNTSNLGVEPLSGQTGSLDKRAPHSNAAQQNARTAALAPPPGSAGYKIGPQDVIEVAVFKVAELSKAVQVSDQGTINMPLVGEIPAAGRTTREVEQDLTKRWGEKYLQNPQVSVFVKEFNSQRVTIQGAVNKPGLFPLQGRMTLLQAISVAQGVHANSDSTIVILRAVDGKNTVAKFDLAQIQSGAAPDPRLQAGDVIVAGKSAAKEMFNNLLRVIPITSTFALL